MELSQEQTLFLRDVARLINIAQSYGYTECSGGELYRTEEQEKLYLQEGKTETMNSYHLKRLAIDLNFFVNSVLISDKTGLQVLGDYWESLDPKNSWGGNWKTFLDCDHFERRV